MAEEKIKVTTAYNVEIEYFSATGWERTLAYLIDAVIKYGYIMLVSLTLFNGLNLNTYWLYLLLCLPAIFYSLILETFNNGKTVGKSAMKLQVVSLDGKNTTIGQYVTRWLLRFLDLLIFTPGLAFLSVTTTLKGQRIGDIVANTAVITQNERQAHRSNLSRVRLPKGYIGRYKEVLQLTDHHIQTIKQVIFNETQARQKIYMATADHIMFLTGIPKTMPSKKYLKMIVYDYNYFQRLEEQGISQEE